MNYQNYYKNSMPHYNSMPFSYNPEYPDMRPYGYSDAYMIRNRSTMPSMSVPGNTMNEVPFIPETEIPFPNGDMPALPSMPGSAVPFLRESDNMPRAQQPVATPQAGTSAIIPTPTVPTIPQITCEQLMELMKLMNCDVEGMKNTDNTNNKTPDNTNNTNSSNNASQGKLIR